MGVKVGKESAQHLFLFVGQEGIGVFQGLEVAEVLKQGFGIGHVLVEVVEIRQNALGPSVENVERWRPLHSLGVASVETAHRVDGVIDRKSRKAVEEVADGEIARCPNRGGVGVAEQIVVDEEFRTLVGKHHHHAAQVGTKLLSQILGDKLKKSRHQAGDNR